MSSLISFLNSGESLEKVVVLTKLAFEHNVDFYTNYDKIRVIYCENLPKKEKGLIAHGTIGGLIEGLNAKSYLKYSALSDLWEDRNYILDRMYSLGRISERMKEKIIHDKTHFDKIIPHFPWYFILEDFKDFLINKFLNCDSVKLEYLDFRKKSDEFFIKMPSYNGMSKPYILNPNGSISSRELWKGRVDINFKKQLEPLRKSIVLSPNIHMFILGSFYFCCEEDKDSLIGFRRFNRTQRHSYDSAIRFLSQQNNSKCVEEPRNKLFNNLLDNIDRDYGYMPIERKINLAIYGYLNEHL